MNDLVGGALLLSYAVLWAVVLVVAAMMIATLRHIGMLFEVVEPLYSVKDTKLRIGKPPPPIPLFYEHGGGRFNFRTMDRHHAFVIVSPGCKPCRQLIAGLAAELAGDHTRDWRLALVVPGIDGLSRLEDEGPLPAGATALLDTQGNVHHVWGVRKTPTVVVVDSGATVRSVVAGPTAESLRAMVSAPLDGPAAGVVSQQFVVTAE